MIWKILTLLCRLRGLRLPPTYTEKDEYGCVRTFSCLLCPEALATTKELEEHVVSSNFMTIRYEIGEPISNLSVLCKLRKENSVFKWLECPE